MAFERVFHKRSVYEKIFYSRWVLCGEHSVLRGGKAITYPLPQSFLKITYENLYRGLQIDPYDAASETGAKNFKSLLQTALRRLKNPKDLKDLKGRLCIQSAWPFGEGLGASAGLSLAVSFFLQEQKLLPENEVKNFALRLENLFHGESSGMDIQAVFYAQPLIYQKNGYAKTLLEPPKPHAAPFLFLSRAGPEKSTKEAILQVKNLWKNRPDFARSLDLQMEKAFALALEALKETSLEAVTEGLKRSLDLSQSCFEKWGLLSARLKAHIEALKSAGALAAKPVGAGFGGAVASLWSKAPEKAPSHWIPLSLQAEASNKEQIQGEDRLTL